MFAPFPTANKPVSVHLYKDGTSESDKFSFNLIALKHQAHYPYWYWKLIEEMGWKYGRQVTKYFNAYVSQETEAVDEEFEKLLDVDRVNLRFNLDMLCTRVLQKLVRLPRSIGMKSRTGLDAFVQFHADCCKMDLDGYTDFLRTWSVVYKPCPLKDFGKKIELKSMIGHPPFGEQALLEFMCFPEIQDHRELVEIHWEQFKVDHVDIRKRLFLANKTDNLLSYWFERFASSPAGIQALGIRPVDYWSTIDRPPTMGVNKVEKKKKRKRGKRVYRAIP